jgi:hypothetical protein
MEHPETRSDFKHADLIKWVTETRSAIIGAILTVTRGYIRAECPIVTDADGKPLCPLGSFENWSRFVRNAIAWAGWGDATAGQADMMVEANPELVIMAQVLEAWFEVYRSQSQTLGEVVKSVDNDGASEPENRLCAALRDLERSPSSNGKLNIRSIGEQLKKYKNRILNGVMLSQGERDKKGNFYFVTQISSQDGCSCGRSIT